MTAGVPLRYNEAQLIVNRAFKRILSLSLECGSSKAADMYAISVHADRRIYTLMCGIIIHLDGVDYCIIMQHRPFHSLRIDNVQLVRAFFV